jgi:hypothetical protein
LFEQVELQLAMFLRTQQVVDLIGINRGLYELEVHAAQDTPMAENVNGVFLLFCTTVLLNDRSGFGGVNRPVG